MLLQVPRGAYAGHNLQHERCHAVMKRCCLQRGFAGIFMYLVYVYSQSMLHHDNISATAFLQYAQNRKTRVGVNSPDLAGPWLLMTASHCH